MVIHWTLLVHEEAGKGSLYVRVRFKVCILKEALLTLSSSIVPAVTGVPDMLSCCVLSDNNREEFAGAVAGCVCSDNTVSEYVY